MVMVAGNYREAAVDNYPAVVQAVARSSAHPPAELNLLGTVLRTLPEECRKGRVLNASRVSLLLADGLR
jgi:hypothetical protein